MALPGKMRVAEIRSGELILAERSLPMLKADEVLIKVDAAGVNRPDIMQRKGLYPPPAGVSDIPGLEVSGTAVKTGSAVKNVSEGDSVCALVQGGGYAEFCAASAELCLPVPDGLTCTEAAGIPETFFTVWSNVFDRGKLKSGEVLLVHGGASGIGTTAIQLATHFGAKVIVTAGSEEKCRACETLGADLAINYKLQDFVAAVTEFTGGAGVNVVLDMIGGEYLARNIKCLAEEGRLIQIAVQQGAKAELNLIPLMTKRLTITGSTLRGRSLAFKADIASNLYEYVWPLLKIRRIKPVIHSVFPLSEAAKAHQLMEEAGHIGKIIIKVT